MNNFNSKGYATILTIITISILSIIILGILNLQSINRRMIQSNESSIRAYYLGESGISLLKNEVDVFFQSYSDDFIETQEVTKEINFSSLEQVELNEEGSVSFKDYVMMQNIPEILKKVRREDSLFSFYPENHGWRLEVVFEEDHIWLYSTGSYAKARKRLVAQISYPNLILLNQTAELKDYQFVSSEFLSYYQGYESDIIE